MTKIEAEKPGSSVIGIDHIELYVSDNCQAARFCRSTLGLQIDDVPELTKQSGDRSSVIVQRRDIRLMLTAPLTASSEVADHIRIHGEGVKDIALTVMGIDQLFERATSWGARAITHPSTQETAHGSLRTACIGIFGDLVHTLVEPIHFKNTCRPDSMACEGSPSALETNLDGVDHVALALNIGELDDWVAFYVEALGFIETHQEQVSTEYSAMRSKVVQSANGGVRFPMIEPASGKIKSQIEHYLERHRGPGAQHLALLSSDIFKSCSALSAAGIEFLPTPGGYYEALETRTGRLSELEALKKFGILADCDGKGILLQVFTKPMGACGTLFLEIIERRGSEGFGAGNIKALFEAVERTHTSEGSV